MAIKYNNPGNIRGGQDYAGETGEFYTASDGSQYVIFDTPEMGLRALFVDLRSKLNEFDGDIDQIINKYAPPSDNNPTQKYAEFVKSKVGKDKARIEDLPKLVSAVINFENKPNVAKTYTKPELLNTAFDLSSVSMPKQTRLADAMELIKPTDKQDLSILETRKPIVDAPVADDTPIIETREEQPVALAQDETPIIQDRQVQEPAAEESVQLDLLEDRQPEERELISLEDDVNVLEQRQKPAATQGIVRDESGIIRTRVAPAETSLKLETDVIKPEDLTPEGMEKMPLKRQPFVPQPVKQQVLSELAQEDFESSVDFGDAAKAAFAEENIMSWMYRNSPEFEPDPDFMLDEKTYSELVKDIPENYRDFVLDSSSLAHAKALRNQVLISMENDRKLAEYGWSGVGLRVAASMLDPAAVFATVATEGVAAPAIWGNKATRLARALRGSFGGAVSTAAIESYLVSQNATKDPYDILYGVAGGFVLGGAIGAALGKSDKEFVSAMQSMDTASRNAQVEDIGKVIQQKGFITETAIPESALPKVALPSSFDPSAGAMANPWSRPVQIPDLRTDTNDFLLDIGEPAFSDLPSAPKLSMTGQLKKSEVPSVRYAGNILGEDAVGFNKGGEVMESTADILKTNATKADFTKYYQVYQTAYTDWAKSQGIGYLKRTFGGTRQQFGELVADAIESPQLNHHPDVVRAAARQSEIFADVLGRAKKAQVKGFDSIPEDLTYFTHLWSPYKFADTNNKYGTDKAVELLKTSIMRGTPEIDEEIAMKMASRMNTKLRKADAGMDSGLARVFSTDQKDVLRDILVDEDILDQADADRLIALFDKPRQGLPSRAKQRLKLDINTELNLENGNIIRIKDLMDRDAEQVFSAYITQMEGRIALAQKGIRSDGDYQRLVQRIGDDAASVHGAGSVDKIKGDLETIDVLYNMILGRTSPLISNPTGTSARLARLAQDYNFIRLMNQVGFAQVAELGNALAIGGFRGLLQVMPEMRSMLKRAKNGELDDSVARDLEAFAGIGADRLINQSMNRYDAQDLFVRGRGDVIDKASFGIQPIKRIVADISGMAPITLALERAAGRMAVQTITDLAFTSRKLSAKRLAGLGLDEDMTRKVLDQIRENAVTTPSAFFKNRKVKSINLSNWQDEAARDAFVLAISRWTRRSIQQNDVGNLNKYMTTTWGKLLTQFRTFMLVSYEKQTLNLLSAKDFRAATAMYTSVFFAGASYIGQTSLNAQFREDKQEYLDERLSVKEIGKAAFQRSSWASLIPAMVDSGALFYLDQPVFAYGRTTGLASNLVTGVPVVDLGQKAHTVITGGSRALLNPDYQWSQSQQRALNSIAPLQNALGIKAGLQKLVDLQPKYDNLD